MSDDSGGYVLVVDDDADIREALKDLLEEWGIEAAGAGDGMEALAQARLREPSLILMDLLMPRMGGAECLGAIREDRSLANVPVILMSAAGDMTLFRGCGPLLLKPMDSDCLVRLVLGYLFLSRKDTARAQH